ncbi:NADH dehydrogenase subunit N [Sphingobacterium allocomposti]|uniref:NADH-quinone oxidoreductase subunit N n=1 Tax=Sphingobacterium allocomposti TaxID=415956 RepID=A0A5S5DAW7_9SPHI|nr:NADH-quinone oxidoreductase subunit N [Sphingobacterium composti Yoo et al. 2007 non Ten et al. 2007]TYP92991.1 NADH dehydrogenase subunit N [Sphingobacterium composti Yoo et al. 2007 non Ten et al. 2007]
MNLSIANILDEIIASVPLLKPELLLIAGFIICIFCALFLQKWWKDSAFAACLATTVVLIYALVEQLGLSATGFSNMWLVDPVGTYARLMIAVSTLIIAIFIQQRYRAHNGDVYSVLLAATLGMNVLAATTNWLLAFIGIEIVSIASYVLVGFFADSKKQAEAAMKYALFGSVCAAVMLYGLSLIYGLTGDLDFRSAQHLQGLMTSPQAMVTIAFLFVFVGIGFKLSFVPFHIWSPDVYQGAPTPVTAFLSTIPKVAALILFMRLYKAWSAGGFYFSDLMVWFMITVAIVTMLVGNLAALRQNDVKRMMAYSSIGHTGFLLMSISAYQDTSSYILFYIFAYVVTNLAAFIFIDHIEQRTGTTELTGYAGLGKKMPLLFVCFTVVAVSLIGLPPTIGFVGKLMIFSAVFDLYGDTQATALVLLLIVGVLTSVISLFFYFRIPLYAFLRNADRQYMEHRGSAILPLLAYVLTALIIFFGLFPDLLLRMLG